MASAGSKIQYGGGRNQMNLFRDKHKFSPKEINIQNISLHGGMPASLFYEMAKKTSMVGLSCSEKVCHIKSHQDGK